MVILSSSVVITFRNRDYYSHFKQFWYVLKFNYELEKFCKS